MPDYQPIQYGKFLLLDRIARGGMAELYRAKIIGSQGFEKLVAIKRILPNLADQEEFVSAFIDEARLAAFLQHRNIVQIFDFGEMAGSYFISMEYLSGLPLRTLMNRAGKNNTRPALGTILFLVAEICAGLDYAHNLKNFSGEPLNIIHRDIGPQNVFITYDGQVKIIDFGIARAASHNSATATGSLKGKIAYMSPEQAGGQEIDRRSDIFSVGIILHELVTGKHLYSGEDAKQLLARAANAAFVPARQICESLPPLLHEILDRALAREPGHRYHSAEQMRNDLEECARQAGGLATAKELSSFMARLFADDAAREEEALRRAASVELPPADEILDSGASPLEQTIFLPTEKPRPRPALARPSLFAVLLAGLALAAFFWLSPDRPEQRPDRLPGRTANTAPANGQAESPLDPHIKARMYFSRLLAGPGKTTTLTPGDLAELDDQTAYLVEKYPAEAYTLLTDLAKKYPDSARIHFQLGRLHTLRRETARAATAYRQALALAPDMDEAFFNLGYLHAQKKEYGEAREMYAKVIELAPAYVDEALFNLALIEKELGQLEASGRHARLALEKNPNNRQAAKLLARLTNKSKEQ
ncbi:protein kinase domain-containing protein [Thiovibrio sp. JS02]